MKMQLNWGNVALALEESQLGAELAARTADNEQHKLEYRIVSSVSAVLANAIRQGLVR